MEKADRLLSISKLEIDGEYFYESSVSRMTMKQTLYNPNVSGHEEWEKMTEGDASPRINGRIFINSYCGQSSMNNSLSSPRKLSNPHDIILKFNSPSNSPQGSPKGSPMVSKMLSLTHQNIFPMIGIWESQNEGQESDVESGNRDHNHNNNPSIIDNIGGHDMTPIISDGERITFEERFNNSIGFYEDVEEGIEVEKRR